MEIKMSSFKEYVKSSIVTFITGFAIAVLPMWGDEPMTKASLFALGMVGVRAGIKGILELFALMKPTKTIK